MTKKENREKKNRIITHAACTDGFCSAFVLKKYLLPKLLPKLTEKQIQNIPIYPIKPHHVSEFEFQETDLVVDLPRPPTPVLFWADHHTSNKPEEQEELPKHFHWKQEHSCAGYLLDLAKEEGVKITKELKEFKEAIDIMDGALYTKKVIKQCFYPQKDYEKPSQLLYLHMLGNMFHTRDRNLNEAIFRTLLTTKLGTTPFNTPLFQSLQPLLFHKAMLKGFKEWREHVDTYVEYNKKAQTVVQDSRKVNISKGIVDRFYVYLKFPDSSYGINVKEEREGDFARIGMGCNIFHKERCKLDIGALCRETAEKFGEGIGGGHYGVGVATVFQDKVDDALKFILKKFEKSLKD